MGGSDAKVRVVEMTSETVLAANRADYTPRTLPAAFYANAGTAGTLRGVGTLPDPAFQPELRPVALETRVPPPSSPQPYRIGVGDVVLIATPQAGSTVEELTGLLAAQNRRQGYTVQDDGQIAIPDVGRIPLAGLTLEEADAGIFQALVRNQIDPAFSLEIAEFNSKRVTIGGAVKAPAIVPITLTPLTLDEALTASGGIDLTDQDYASIRIYRGGTLYQIPLREYFTNRSLRGLRLIDGDSIFVDTDFELEKAEAYFEQQIRMSEFRQRARTQSLAELTAEVDLRRAALQESRSNYSSQIEFGAVDRDYVYLAGEVLKQSRFVLPFSQTATLADALYEEGGFKTETANPAEIYVLRGSANPTEFGSLTAWHLNARNAANLVLATRFELRPDDVIFVAEQPITRWNRALQQFVPSLLTTGAGLALN